MDSAEGTVAQQLARFVTKLELGDFSPQVIDKAKELLLDQLGCQLIGSTLEWNKIIYRFIMRSGGRSESTIVNHGDKVLAADAAFVNGTFGQGCELDDYCLRSGHAGAFTIPAAMALGEKEDIDGKTFLTAIIASYEVSGCTGMALFRSAIKRGFHPQSVNGVFGSAAAAGKILRLNAEEMTHAFAIAGSHSCGSGEYDQSGGEVKRMHTGLAVRGGIHSAMLARMGLTGPLTIFEGKRGVFSAFAGEYDLDAVTRDMGQGFGVMDAIIKRHACNGTQHSSIDVLTDLVEEYGFKPSEVESISAAVPERLLLHGGAIYEPHEAIAAQFSLSFSLALRLLKGSNELFLYMDPKLWHDPQILETGRKLKELRADPEVGDRGCRMQVTLSSGKTVEGYLEYPKGHFKNPLTKDELYSKFRKLASSVLPAERIEKVIAKVENIEDVGDLSGLISLLVK